MAKSSNQKLKLILAGYISIIIQSLKIKHLPRKPKSQKRKCRQLPSFLLLTGLYDIWLRTASEECG